MMLAALEQRFDVTRIEDDGLDDELAIRELVRPTIALRPADPEAAPLTVAFTDFPGLSIRFGRWSTKWFPTCGCDACAENTEDEIDRLTKMVDILTAGGFREAIVYSPAWWKPRWGLVAKPGTSAPQAGYASHDGTPEEIRSLEKRLGMGPEGSRLETVFKGPTGWSSSGSLLSDSRALQMSGGRHRLDLDWKPWPQQG